MARNCALRLFDGMPRFPSLAYPWNGELQFEDADALRDDVDNGSSHAAATLGTTSKSAQQSVTIHRGFRVRSAVLIKRVPAALIDGTSVDFNIQLSAAIENEERLYSGGVHHLKTLTCQYWGPPSGLSAGWPGPGTTGSASSYSDFLTNAAKSATAFYIALEACDLNLHEAVQRSRLYGSRLLPIQPLDAFEEDDAPLLLWRARRSVARQLVAGVSFLHRKQVYHNALKPSNVLLKNGIAKLAEINCYSLPPSAEEEDKEHNDHHAGVAAIGAGPANAASATGSSSGAAAMPIASVSDDPNAGVCIPSAAGGFCTVQPAAPLQPAAAAAAGRSQATSSSLPVPHSNAPGQSEWAPLPLTSDGEEEKRLIALIAASRDHDHEHHHRRADDAASNNAAVASGSSTSNSSGDGNSSSSPSGSPSPNGNSPGQATAAPSQQSRAELKERLYKLRGHRDTFALGCLIYHVLTLGKHPLGTLTSSDGRAAGTAIKNIRKRVPSQSYAADISSLLAEAAQDAAQATSAVALGLEAGAIQAALEDSADGTEADASSAQAGVVGNVRASAAPPASSSTASGRQQDRGPAFEDQTDDDDDAAAAGGSGDVDVDDHAMASSLSTASASAGVGGTARPAVVLPSAAQRSTPPRPPPLSTRKAGGQSVRRGRGGIDESDYGQSPEPRASHTFSSAGVSIPLQIGAAAPSSSSSAMYAGKLNGGGPNGLYNRNSAVGRLKGLYSGSWSNRLANGISISAGLDGLQSLNALPSSGSGLLGAASLVTSSINTSGAADSRMNGNTASSSSSSVLTSSAAASAAAKNIDVAALLRERATNTDTNAFHHQHYAQLADTTDHEEAADLVLALMSPDHELRMTPSAALAHPFFWSTTRKFLLITLISEGTVVQQDRAKGRHATFASAIQTAFLARLPQDAHGHWGPLFPLPPGCGADGWNSKLWPHRDPISYEAVYAGPYSMYALVRWTRNLYIHGQEHVRTGLFPSQAHLEAHVLGAFPWLVVELWKVDQALGGRFTAQTLAGGTSRVVVGDGGIDAEYDTAQSAHTVTLLPQPGAAGERQNSNPDLQQLAMDNNDDDAGGNDEDDNIQGGHGAGFTASGPGASAAAGGGAADEWDDEYGRPPRQGAGKKAKGDRRGSANNTYNASSAPPAASNAFAHPHGSATSNSSRPPATAQGSIAGALNGLPPSSFFPPLPSSTAAASASSSASAASGPAARPPPSAALLLPSQVQVQQQQQRVAAAAPAQQHQPQPQRRPQQHPEFEHAPPPPPARTEHPAWQQLQHQPQYQNQYQSDDDRGYVGDYEDQQGSAQHCQRPQLPQQQRHQQQPRGSAQPYDYSCDEGDGADQHYASYGGPGQHGQGGSGNGGGSGGGGHGYYHGGGGGGYYRRPRHRPRSDSWYHAGGAGADARGDSKK